MDAAKMQGSIKTAQTIDKAFLAGEFGWDKGNLTQFLEAALQGGAGESDGAATGADSVALAQKGAPSGSEQVLPAALFSACFWSFFPHADSHGFVPHGDHYTMHFPGDSTQMLEGVVAIRDFAFRMQGKAPPVAASWPPVVTSPEVTQLNASGLAWRGAALAWNYTIQRSSGGTTGPWSTVCDECASDLTDPVPLPQGTQPGDGFRVAGAGRDGGLGPWSAAAAWSGAARPSSRT